ncbi:hypothetical protein [Mesorhizobium sp. WSM3224]|uniref:hypothetical protein n=1 Tax=Mesorhizobium sp. WSM3224 TaxID=1040986 RepID=UPI000410DF2C|nr:hypothetical protein [Mesorhizobium sp. WSM3224]
MTLRYVRSSAAGSANGTNWANAYTTVLAALTAAAAGDTIYVSEDHSETSATLLKHTSPGTVTAPVKVICVDHAGSVPPVSADLRTTAVITSSSGSGLAFDSSDSFTVYDGFAITSAAMFNLCWNPRVFLKFRNCALRLSGSGGNYAQQQSGTKTILENTTLQFGSVSQPMLIDNEFVWRNTPSAIQGATLPSTLFSTAIGNIYLDGVDLSALTGILFGAASNQVMRAEMVDCKINASATIGSTPTRYGYIRYTRVDSGGTNYKHGLIKYEGTQSVETTIVLTGGANDGTTSFSWKIVTTANCSEHFPFESLPIAIWNDTTGSSVTATVQGIWGGGAVPNNDDIWCDVEYLGASGSPLASFVNDGKADILASNAAQDAGSGTWGGSTTKFKLNVSFTPQQKGWILLRVKAAKASSTFYIDPKITLS